jgi:hypothetical protein
VCLYFFSGQLAVKNGRDGEKISTERYRSQRTTGVSQFYDTFFLSLSLTKGKNKLGRVYSWGQFINLFLSVNYGFLLLARAFVIGKLLQSILNNTLA